MTTRIALVAVLAALLGPAPAQATTPDQPRLAAPLTLANLQSAFEADTHAQARYVAFAAKADQEGYPGAARIFRAAARSEQVRAGNHARALRHLGGEATLPAQARVTVNATRQNLLDTLAQENAERSDGYPRLVRQAREEGDGEAVLSFTLAHAAEGSLVKLYQEALANLARMRQPGAALHVCASCGHVVRGGVPDQCPACLSGREAFERVG